MNIAFFCDRQMLPGLHVALLSLLESAAHDEFLDIVIFSVGLREQDERRLFATYELCPERARLTIRPAAMPSISGANSLHGNVTVYGRIFLADLLPDCETVLYLDSDILVRKPLSRLFGCVDENCTLYADGCHPRAWTIDKQLFEEAGLDMAGSSFNSGVLLINLNRWRSLGKTAECLECCQRFAGKFRSADQALLNVVFASDFHSLGATCNTPLYPSTSHSAALVEEAHVCHFVGTPKPWDPFGQRVHPYYELWRNVYARTAIRDTPVYRYWTLSRMLRTSRSTLAAMRKRPS